MYNQKEIKDTNRSQKRSNSTKNDKKEENININLIGPKSSTITVLKRDEEERGKLYNVYEISVPSKSKPNVDTTKQVREVTPENYKQSLRVPDISRRLNVPTEDDSLKNVNSKKKESFQERDGDDTEFESDRNYRDDKDAEVGLYKLKRDYNTFAFPTLTEKGKQSINKFSLSEDSPTSSLGDFSITSSLDLKVPPLNKLKENKKVTFSTKHARPENIKPLNEPNIKKTTQIEPNYLKPDNKKAPNLVIPTIMEPKEKFRHSDSFNNFSDTKWNDDLENTSLDSEISFNDIDIKSQLNKPKEKKKVSLTIPHELHKNEKPLIKKLTKVGPQYLKPENKMKTNTFIPKIIESSDNLSNITKWDDNCEDSSSDSDFLSFLSSDISQLNKPEGKKKVSLTTPYDRHRNEKPFIKKLTQVGPQYLKPENKMKNNTIPKIIEPTDNLSDITKWDDNYEDNLTDSEFPSFPSSDISQLNKPEGKKTDSTSIITRRYERKYKKIVRKITPGVLKPTKLEPTKGFPISDSLDNLSDITKWHDDLGDSSLESLKSQYRPYRNSLTRFPDILPEINKLFAEPYGEKSTLAYSPDDNEQNFDTTSVVEKPISYTDNLLDPLKEINSISSLEEEKDNLDNLMKPREDYFDDHLPYLQKHSNMKPKDSVTILDKYPNLATFTDSRRRSTISGNYFDKNIPYLEKIPGENEKHDEIIYSSILNQPLDEIFETFGQDSKKARASYERYFDEHLPYLENRPKELKLETSDNYIDKHLPFLDIKPEKIENKNEIVQPTSLEKSPDQISNSESQKSEKSSTSSGKYFNKLLSYFIKKPDREETISTDSKGSKGSSGKYFNKNIPYLFKKANKEEIDNKGSKDGSINPEKYLDDNISLIKEPDIEENIISLRDSPTSSGTHSDENKPLKKNTIVVSDEIQVMPYLELSPAPFSETGSENSKRSRNGKRTSQVEKLESEYEEIPEKYIKDENGQWIFIGYTDETNPFGHQNTFDGDGVETSNYEDSNFDSDPENRFSRGKRLNEDNQNNNVNDTNIYSENGRRLSNDVKRNGSDERISTGVVPLQEYGGRKTSARPPSVSWNGEVRTNGNNTLDRSSIPRNSRFYQDIYADNDLQVLPLQVPINNDAFEPDRNQVGSLENKPGKMSIVEERDQAKRTGYPYRGKSLVSEEPIKYKETIPRRNTYNDEYRTPEYKVPQAERRSLNYPTYQDKNIMTDGSYNTHNNQDELWFGTIKSQTYGPGDSDKTPRDDRPSKPRDSSVRPSESPQYSEVNDYRRGPSIPGRKSTKYSDKRPSSVISLPEKENTILNKKLPKSADDAAPAVRDEKKPKKKRFKSFHLPTSKPQDNSNFGVVGTAVLSHKPIPPKETPEYPNKDLIGSLTIKGSKINAICNLYFDPRLKELILDQLGFIGGEIRRRRIKKKRKADEKLYLADSTSSTVANR